MDTFLCKVEVDSHCLKSLASENEFSTRKSSDVEMAASIVNLVLIPEQSRLKYQLSSLPVVFFSFRCLLYLKAYRTTTRRAVNKPLPV
jgi:hypothetical protein